MSPGCGPTAARHVKLSIYVARRSEWQEGCGPRGVLLRLHDRLELSRPRKLSAWNSKGWKSLAEELGLATQECAEIDTLNKEIIEKTKVSKTDPLRSEYILFY